MSLIGIPVGESVRIVHRDTKPELCVNWTPFSKATCLNCAFQNESWPECPYDGSRGTLHIYARWVSDTRIRIWRALTHTQRAVADQSLHLELRIPRILILVQFLWDLGICHSRILAWGVQFHIEFKPGSGSPKYEFYARNGHSP